MKNKTESFYQPLFDHMHQEHGLFLLESEMADIILVVRKMDTDEHVVKGMPPLEEPILSDEDMKAWERDREKDKSRPQGAVWVKDRIKDLQKHLIDLADDEQNQHEKNVINHRIGELHMAIQVINKYAYFLDESPSKESDAVDFGISIKRLDCLV